MIECVPNFSDGRNSACADAIERAISSVEGVLVLHRTSDPDHNRGVITFAGVPEAVLEAAVRATAAAAATIDLNRHAGVHPRLGALDVLPFVPLEGATLEECVDLAHRAGERIWSELRIPVYFYAAAATRPERDRLEDVRRGQFEGLREAALIDESKRPDVGGPALHATAGAVIVGARRFLIALNVDLKTTDVRIAKDIARNIRASNGGLPAVKALGLLLPSRGVAQVSMNLTDFERTGIGTVLDTVCRLAAERGVEIAGVELIGLAPRRAIADAGDWVKRIEDFGPQKAIENRIETLFNEKSGGDAPVS